jgi:hypothetical protein
MDSQRGTTIDRCRTNWRRCDVCRTNFRVSRLYSGREAQTANSRLKHEYLQRVSAGLGTSKSSYKLVQAASSSGVSQSLARDDSAASIGVAFSPCACLSNPTNASSLSKSSSVRWPSSRAINSRLLISPWFHAKPFDTCLETIAEIIFPSVRRPLCAFFSQVCAVRRLVIGI